MWSDYNPEGRIARQNFRTHHCYAQTKAQRYVKAGGYVERNEGGLKYMHT